MKDLLNSDEPITLERLREFFRKNDFSEILRRHGQLQDILKIQQAEKAYQERTGKHLDIPRHPRADHRSKDLRPCSEAL